MNITLETGENCQAKLRAEVPQEDVQSQRDQITSGFAQKARIPGYRPGKVPRQVLEKRFGKAIRAQLEKNLIESALREAQAKEELRILKIQDVEAVDNVDLTYTITADLLVAPKFELPEYKGIPVTLPQQEVRDDHIERVVDDWKNNNARFEEEPEGTQAAMGHYLELDYRASLDGEEIDAAKYPEAQIYLRRANGYLFMDEGAFLPGFCGELLEHVVGEPFTFKLTLPEDFPVEDLRGKEVEYAVRIHRIQKKMLPELTDEKVEETTEGQLTTVEAFEERIRQQLTQRMESHTRQSAIDQCLQQLLARVEFELPEEMVTQEAQEHVDRIVQNSQRRGVEDERLIEQESEIVEAASRMGRRDVKTKFILNQIAQKERLKVSNEEIMGRVTMLAHQAGIPPRKAMRNLQKNGRIHNIIEEILLAKTLDFVRENASVQTDEARNALDELWEGKGATD